MPPAIPMDGRREERRVAVGLRGLSVLIGVFLIFMGLGKTAWLTDGGFLLAELERWRGPAPPW